MSVIDLQRRLADLGFDPGPRDGVRGRLTIAAIKAFQSSRKLVVDGLAGPATWAALLGADGRAQGGAAPDKGAGEPAWLTEARRWMGMREIAGPASNPRIVAWGRAAERWYVNDDIPWCGAFMFAQFAAALPEEPLPVGPLFARNWRTFGVPLATPVPGAVLVFERGPSAGHVGFYVGEAGARFRVLGGNQSNAVNETWIAKNRLLATRWPKTGGKPAGGRVVSAARGATSMNEA